MTNDMPCRRCGHTRTHEAPRLERWRSHIGMKVRRQSCQEPVENGWACTCRSRAHLAGVTPTLAGRYDPRYNSLNALRLILATLVIYGMYIWAFPVQQLIAITLIPHGLSVWGYVPLAIVLTVPFAWASWIFVERPSKRSARLGWAAFKPSEIRPSVKV